jgi:hypothetical protein
MATAGRMGSPTWRGAEALAIAAVLVVLYLIVRRQAARSKFTIDAATPIASDVDGRAYRVQTGLARSRAAADALAAINGRLVDVMRWLRRRYVRDTDEGARYPARRQAALYLLRRYDPDHLVENSPKDPDGESSFVQSKGEIFAICLRDKTVFDLHDYAVLMFVSLHELTHVAIDVLDHPREFWETFKFILLEAETAGIYTSPDFEKTPVTYCGIDVAYNPRYDPAVKTI